MRRIIDGSEKTNVRPRWWLIAKNGNAGWEFLTPDGDGEETLAVFGHEEEAKMFLHLGGYSDDSWRVRESSTGEIVRCSTGRARTSRALLGMALGTSSVNFR